MHIRCDGEQTREKIIEVACRVFSNKGFQDATHEVICGLAGVNKAAINHHFGDKKSLYRIVWQHLLDAADQEHPVSGNLPEDATAIERLEAHVRSLLNRHCGEGASWQLARLREAERVSPTGLVDDIRRSHHDRNRKQMLSTLKELLGNEASRSTIEFYETSVLALVRADWPRSAVLGAGNGEVPPIGTRKLNTLAKQITQFVLSGIEAKVQETSRQ